MSGKSSKKTSHKGDIDIDASQTKRKREPLEEGEIVETEGTSKRGAGTEISYCGDGSLIIPQKGQKKRVIKTKKKAPLVITLPNVAQQQILELARRGDFSTHTSPKCRCIILGITAGEDKLCQKNCRKGGDDIYCAEHDAPFQEELASLATGKASRMRTGPSSDQTEAQHTKADLNQEQADKDFDDFLSFPGGP